MCINRSESSIYTEIQRHFHVIERHSGGCLPQRRWIFSCGNTANPADGKPSVRTSGNRLMCEFAHTMLYPSHIPRAWICHARHQCLWCWSVTVKPPAPPTAWDSRSRGKFRNEPKRSGTVSGGMAMTSTELKHQAQIAKWTELIKERRSSGLPG